jgi:4-cresol dehydrogenase (hydroxylating) cytochrome subunit
MKKRTSKKASAAFMLVAMVAMGVVAGAAWAEPHQAPEQGYAWKDGGEVYQKVCALCHETKVGPVILGQDLDSAYIQMVVRQGNEAMPAFRASEIDDHTLQKLAEYVAKSAADK